MTQHAEQRGGKQHDSKQHGKKRQGSPKEAWDAIAADYDRFVTPGNSELAIHALELANLKPGDRFLDVAAGSGALSIPAAKLGARIVATDWSPRMIEKFRKNVDALELPNAEGRVMDCHTLDFPDDSFDVAGSQFGVMLVPDQASALREMVRVTRPGGRVVLIGFGCPTKFEALQFFIGAIKSVVPGFPGLPNDPPPLEFQVSNPAVLKQRLSDAGLRDVVIDTDRKETLEFKSGQDLWNWCLGSNPIPGMLVSGLDDKQKKKVRKKLDEMIAERAGNSKTAILAADINIGIGTKMQA